VSASIAIDDRGIATLEISGTDGDTASYTITAARPGLSLWACTLTRLDSESSYRVSLEHTGFWNCTCPAWKYRRHAEDVCKHCRAVKPLHRFIIALASTEKDHEYGCSHTGIRTGRN
jgi:hypothetical protein